VSSVDSVDIIKQLYSKNSNFCNKVAKNNRQHIINEMTVILLSLVAFLSTLLGGFAGLKNKDHLHRFLGYTAGVLLGVVAFDILPEIYNALQETGQTPTASMVALVVGFLLFHTVEKSILIHHSQESEYEQHHHPHVGVASAIALSGHSLLDGIGIGLGFQAGNKVGIAVAIAVIAHDFTDGLNTVNLMLLNKNKSQKAVVYLFLDAAAPIIGALSTLLFQIPNNWLPIYLGFFAGFLLYIGASEILPEAHSKHSSYKTILTTIMGAAFIFLVTHSV
jgi:zinc transporter ZupT